MEDYSIRIINDKQIETKYSVYDIDLTFQLWKENMTPWEHRRVFRQFKIPYNIGNKYAPEIYDIKLNYDKLIKKMDEYKNLNRAYKKLSFAKVCYNKNYNLCDDIISKIIQFK